MKFHNVTISIDDLHPEEGWGTPHDKSVAYLENLWEEFGCFGTLIKHINDGDNVHILIMSNGDVKHSVTNKTLRISEQTKLESKTAANLINANLIQLDFPDREVPFTVE